MKKNFLVFLTFSLLFSASCGQRETDTGSTATSTATSSAADSKPMTVKGSDTMVVLGQRFAEEYMKRNPGTIVQINGGGSGTGIAALINGTIDLAQSSRSMKDQERQKVQEQRNAAVVETAVAIDSLAVFVNEQNPVRELSVEQLAGIYTGKTKNWSEVGGKKAPIVLYGRESSSGTYDYFKENVLDKADFSPTAQTLQGTAAIVNAVARDGNGIGYGGIAYARNVRAIAIKGKGASAAVAPSENSVADSSYPLSRKLFFYTLQNSPERVSRFVEFALSPEGQAVVKAADYFPLTTGGPGDQGTSTAPATSTDAQNR